MIPVRSVITPMSSSTPPVAAAAVPVAICPSSFCTSSRARRTSCRTSRPLPSASSRRRSPRPGRPSPRAAIVLRPAFAAQCATEHVAEAERDEQRATRIRAHLPLDAILHLVHVGVADPVGGALHSRRHLRPHLANVPLNLLPGFAHVRGRAPLPQPLGAGFQLVGQRGLQRAGLLLDRVQLLLRLAGLLHERAFASAEALASHRSR